VFSEDSDEDEDSNKEERESYATIGGEEGSDVMVFETKVDIPSILFKLLTVIHSYLLKPNM
jgi:hypothetical protein